MIRWLRNMLVALRSIDWLPAAVAVRAEQRYQDALDGLSRRFEPPTKDGPSPDAPLLANILFADLNVCLERMAPAYYACASALEQMADPKNPLQLRPANVRYLRYHCKWMLTQTSRFVDSEAFKLALSITETWAEIDLPRTGSLFKEMFPIPADYALRFDEYIAENAAL